MALNKNTLFYTRLIELSKENNLSLNQIEKDLDYPKDSLNNYSSNDVIPSEKRLTELSCYFDVTPEYLSGRSNCKHHSYLELVFDRLNEDEKNTLFDIANDWHLNNKEQE